MSILRKIVIIIACSLCPVVALSEYSIPTSRSIDWTAAGVDGGITNRTTIYTTLSPSGSDDTDEIETAVANCPVGQVVKLGTGTFQINASNQLTLTKSNITLRGNGVGNTLIDITADGTQRNQLFTIGNSIDSGSLSNLSLTANTSKGDTTISLSSGDAATLSTGDYVVVTQENANDVTTVSNVGVGS